MTIQQLYDYAKENNILDYEIEVQYADEGGFYCGARETRLDDIEIQENIKTVVL